VSKRKLLLADDSVTIQKVVNLTFADEGIEVIAVGDGDSAMEKLAEISPDLVMADVNMPGLNGYQICEQIKQDELLRNTPVILLVGSFEPFDEAEAERVGADDFLTKPFQSIRQLVNKVTALLKSNPVRVAADERHLADTLEMENPNLERIPEISTPVQFDDSGMDDEMIQTNQVSNYALDESAKFETRVPAEDLAKTQPLTAVEMKDFDFSQPLESEEIQAEVFHTNNNEAGLTETIEDREAEDAKVETVAGEFEEEPVADEITVFRDVEEVADEIEANPEIEEAGLGETSQIPVAEEVNESEEKVEEAFETVTDFHDEAIPMPEIASILQDEGDLLELPPIESDYEDEDEDEFEEEDSVPVESVETIPAEPLKSSSEQISSELIEAIANRVMEKLSEKAVKEVAWEVVPQMTELIVKKMAEEKLKD
jgi:CheY-like chemotaxis protein